MTTFDILSDRKGGTAVARRFSVLRFPFESA
jgi:hypothetical protein